MNKCERTRADVSGRVTYDRLPALWVHAERRRRLFILGERVERHRAFRTRRLDDVDCSRRRGVLEVSEVVLELADIRVEF